MQWCLYCCHTGMGNSGGATRWCFIWLTVDRLGSQLWGHVKYVLVCEKSFLNLSNFSWLHSSRSQNLSKPFYPTIAVERGVWTRKCRDGDLAMFEQGLGSCHILGHRNYINLTPRPSSLLVNVVQRLCGNINVTNWLPRKWIQELFNNVFATWKYFKCQTSHCGGPLQYQASDDVSTTRKHSLSKSLYIEIEQP